MKSEPFFQENLRFLKFKNIFFHKFPKFTNLFFTKFILLQTKDHGVGDIPLSGYAFSVIFLIFTYHANAIVEKRLAEHVDEEELVDVNLFEHGNHRYRVNSAYKRGE